MYFAQRGMRLSPPLTDNNRRSSQSMDDTAIRQERDRTNTEPGVADGKEKNQNSSSSSNSADEIDDISWKYSSRFLNSALNSACVMNELKSGNIQIETEHVIRRFTKPPHLQQRIEETISVSYMIIPVSTRVRCKINIVEEMVHISVDLCKTGVSKDVFFCAKTNLEAMEWGDAMLKGISPMRSPQTVPYDKDANEDNQTIEKAIRFSLEIGGEAVLKDIQERQQQRIDEFTLVFLICTDKKLRDIGSNGGLEKSTIRSLCWLSFLNFFPRGSPTSSWPSIIQKARQEYETEKDILWGKMSTDKNATSSTPPSKGVAGKKATEGSLSLIILESPGSNSFEKVMNYDLMVNIEKDVLRTYNKVAFFRHHEVRESMMRILSIYALANPSVSYKQGMNDLVAAILLLLHRERTLLQRNAASDQKEEGQNGRSSVSTTTDAKNVEFFLDQKFVEHDAYLIFTLMINRMKYVFCPKGPFKPKINQWVNGNSSNMNENILTRLAWIQNIRLRRLNERLPVHFLKLGIQPHMYLLPWIRLLFAREYCMEALWLVWDAIFAISPDDFGFSDYICVAMIELNKNTLIDCDDMASVLLFLQKPKLRSVAEALLVIDHAKTLWDEDNGSQEAYKPHGDSSEADDTS